ncbi:MAG: DNA polymerase III subunit alpha [Lachnospiraceae bacterium]|nr:DNA polymerase III subunit alpha [Lachnospiraceae bacterium]
MLFTHLHTHTGFSLLDGMSNIPELINRTKELGMDSIAITDHGAMFGAIDFYKAAKAAGIKPIIGCEVYVAQKSRLEHSPADSGYFHLVLLAENNEGYDNLIKLVSYGYIDGFYYKPRIDLPLLKKYSHGLIGSSACLAGAVPQAILYAGYEEAKKVALEYDGIFGRGNFFLELQDHGIEEQKTVNSALIKIHEETGIPLIATNDSHYIYKDDSVAHDILLCVQTAKTVNDTDRMRYFGSEFYLKSPEEMAALFHYAPEAIENTHKIAERCNVEFKFHEFKLPRFNVPAGKKAAEYLKELCFKGLEKKYTNPDESLVSRLLYELETIETMGYSDYFLIVWDFIRFAKENGIPVGPGRGSAAGSIAAYSLDITNIDPIKYDLIFERFLNPERVSMPDIDIDFCYERRQEVIDYVKSKYGEDHVAQIITFGTLSAKAVIKDVGRALSMPYGDVDKISKMVPFAPDMTIDRALNMNPDLMNEYMTNEEVHYLIDMSKRLEGLPRHSSTHAAGVVICSKPVMEYVPLSATDGAISTQYSMGILEELGLLKMDFLGLRTLTVIQKTLDEIKRTCNEDIDIDNIDTNDPKVYEFIAQGKTEGLFQLESQGMKQFMKELKPSCLEDLIAGISLYRPGPMDFIPKYIKGKNSLGNIQYTHPSLTPILENTYGCIVYQEQVMQIVRDLAGYSLGRSDLVRRAMSKKKTDVMAKERKNFVYGIPEENVPGCVKNGIPAGIAEKIFDDMTDFAKYAFNKSHAACYAMVGYETAWLKAYYPVQFMAALMSSVMDNMDKVSEYIAECKKMELSLLPPDVNEGFANFSVSGDKIRFGLAAIKNVGANAIKAMVSIREKNGKYKSLTDFCERLSDSSLSRRAIESLIKAGAFDSLGGKRSQYMEIHKTVLESVSRSKKEQLEGQMTFFDIEDNSSDEENMRIDVVPDIDEFPQKELLSMEKEVLGIYVGGHPLSEFEDIVKKYSSTDTAKLLETEDGYPLVSEGEDVDICGIVSVMKTKYTKTNKQMAYFRLEDIKGSVEIIMFPDSFEKYGRMIFNDDAVLVHGKADTSGDEVKVICRSIIRLKDIMAKELPNLIIGVIIPKNSNITFNDIKTCISRHKGNLPLYIQDKNKSMTFKTSPNAGYGADGSKSFIDELKELLGDENVVINKK